MERVKGFRSNILRRRKPRKSAVPGSSDPPCATGWCTVQCTMRKPAASEIRLANLGLGGERHGRFGASGQHPARSFTLGAVRTHRVKLVLFASIYAMWSGCRSTCHLHANAKPLRRVR